MQQLIEIARVILKTPIADTTDPLYPELQERLEKILKLQKEGETINRKEILIYHGSVNVEFKKDNRLFVVEWEVGSTKSEEKYYDIRMKYIKKPKSISQVRQIYEGITLGHVKYIKDLWMNDKIDIPVNVDALIDDKRRARAKKAKKETIKKKKECIKGYTYAEICVGDHIKLKPSKAEELGVKEDTIFTIIKVDSIRETLVGNTKAYYVFIWIKIKGKERIVHEEDFFLLESRR